MSDTQILGLYLIGVWVFSAPDLSKRTRQLSALAFLCASIAMTIRIVLKILS